MARSLQVFRVGCVVALADCNFKNNIITVGATSVVSDRTAHAFCTCGQVRDGRASSATVLGARAREVADRRRSRRCHRPVGRRYPGAAARAISAQTVTRPTAKDARWTYPRVGRRLWEVFPQRRVYAPRRRPYDASAANERQTLRPRTRGIVHCRNYYRYYLLLLSFRRRTV